MKIIDSAPRVIGWLVFIAGCGLLMWIDYGLRLRTGDVRTGGVPDAIWFSTPLMLGAFSLSLIWRAAKKWQRRWVGVVELIAHLAFGVLVYLGAGLYYILGNGIDTL
jgi:hypothetical protein